jgi:hypothetical protein
LLETADGVVTADAAAVEVGEEVAVVLAVTTYLHRKELTTLSMESHNEDKNHLY